MSNASYPLKAKIPAGIGILILTLIVVGAIYIGKLEMPGTITPANTPIVSSTASNHAYKDGTYTAVGTYISPAGKESLSVTITLAASTVTDSMVTRMANDPTASSYQSLFINGYRGMVVGKKLADIKLSNVSGSSLTPKGFMDALDKIETDARA